ncbi:aldolase [Martelella mediterranea]|uniref:HpcH/HpaI aldolase family protein n=1 Tax=Martelella mediterranea TaxID=293089 RepID=UPI001E37556D|nr:aldolase/citrate lyase family protein [Martelella mediterranea]MCD1633354.1 aldolase [Martelella mediterranea]
MAQDLARGFRHRVLGGDRLFGTFLKTPTTHAAEILAQEGYDFVVIDEEHAPFNPETTDRILMACHHAGIAGVVRVSRIEDILRVLDSGADGVLVPHVDSAERAKAVVASARYRGGARGFSNTTRAGRYGSIAMAEHIAAQDNGVAVIAMIEDRSAIGRLDEIAAVEGVDAFFIGRGDLTVAFEAESQAAAEVVGAVEAITAAAARAGRKVFVMSGAPDDARTLSDQGATGFIMASDQGFLRQGAKDTLARFAGVLN